MLTFWILVFFVETLAHSNLYIQLIAEHYSCDPSCTFNHPELSSNTIEFFPKCEVVCGMLTINGNTDLTEVQLKEVFWNMKTLNGGIRIENSNLETLSFFGSQHPGLKIDCGYFGILIKNNPNLIDIVKITEFNFSECPIRIEHNPKLSTDSFCDTGHLSTVVDIKTFGNSRDCECPGHVLTSATLSQFSTCSLVFGGLNISKTHAPLNLSITQIRGPLTIQNTSLENLTFLASLESLKYDEGLVLDIKDNPNMTRLGFSAGLKFQGRTSGNFMANLENLHPDFCVTFEEMSMFLEARFQFKNFHGKYCPANSLCKFESLKTLAKNCSHIFGDVVIQHGDEGYTKKLETVTHLFGSIVIRNTTLKNANFLKQLRYVAYLEEHLPVIRIISNKYLTSVKLPDLKHVISNGETYGVLQDNPKLIMESKLVHFYGDEDCPGNKLYILGLKFYKNCEALVDGLIITAASQPPSDYGFLTKVTSIDGPIEISNTNLESVSFLKSLQWMNLEEQRSGIFIDIHHSPNMTSLGWKMLGALSSPGYFDFTMNFEALHPDFCLTIHEMIVFMASEVNFRFLEASYCSLTKTDEKERTCQFVSMKKIKNRCLNLVGDVLVEGGDEEFVWKLSNVEFIFGTLTIWNTSLENLDCLNFLGGLASLSEAHEPIRIVNNTNLKSVSLLGFVHRVISKTSKTFLIAGNSNGVFNSTKECMELQFLTGTNISYNGASCRAIDRVSGGSINCFKWMLIFYVSLFLF